MAKKTKADLCGEMTFTLGGNWVCDRPAGHEGEHTQVAHDCSGCGVGHGTCRHCGTTHGDGHSPQCVWGRQPAAAKAAAEPAQKRNKDVREGETAAEGLYAFWRYDDGYPFVSGAPVVAFCPNGGVRIEHLGTFKPLLVVPTVLGKQIDQQLHELRREHAKALAAFDETWRRKVADINPALRTTK